MKWRGRRTSTNVEDRRGMGGRGLAIGGIGGVGGVILLVVLLLSGADPSTLIPGAGQTSSLTQGQRDEAAQFVSVVLADTEQVWSAQFRKRGGAYREPKLVLFTGAVDSACGTASSAIGPFYCPSDQSIYIDVEFFVELKDRFGAPGDFAQAYVIAHEVGHHIQKITGTMDGVHARQQRTSRADANDLSVRLELQADFLAGVWAHYAETDLGTLEPGDLEEAMRAASAVGDDRIQMEAQGYVVPDSFTHGTSAQRRRWFMRGYQTGDLSKGDTFNGQLD